MKQILIEGLRCLRCQMSLLPSSGPLAKLKSSIIYTEPKLQHLGDKRCWPYDDHKLRNILYVTKHVKSRLISWCLARGRDAPVSFKRARIKAGMA